MILASLMLAGAGCELFSRARLPPDAQRARTRKVRRHRLTPPDRSLARFPAHQNQSQRREHARINGVANLSVFRSRVLSARSRSHKPRTRRSGDGRGNVGWDFGGRWWCRNGVCVCGFGGHTRKCCEKSCARRECLAACIYIY